MRYIFLCQALCVNPFVVPSLIKCHCPDYPAVRQRSEWVSSNGRERGGGEGGVCEWDAHWPCHHHKPPVWSNILTGWMSGWLGTHQASSLQLQHQPLFGLYDPIIGHPPQNYNNCYCSWKRLISLPWFETVKVVQNLNSQLKRSILTCGQTTAHMLYTHTPLSAYARTFVKFK